jgi:hypothetical protein
LAGQILISEQLPGIFKERIIQQGLLLCIHFSRHHLRQISSQKTKSELHKLKDKKIGLNPMSLSVHLNKQGVKGKIVECGKIIASPSGDRTR